jgi:hypothetical protein
MSTQTTRSNDATTVAVVDMKLAVVVIPTLTSTARRSSTRSSGMLDADCRRHDWRVIQFTPPGSGCSVIFGKNVTAAAPGSAQGLYLIVADIGTARADLRRRGVAISEVFHAADGPHAGTDEPYLFGRRRVSGADPEHRTYRTYASFRDPDGNGWLFQEVTTRLPGRIDPATTTFASVSDLASALRRAEAAHGEHEKRTGQRDADGRLVRRVHGGGADRRNAARVNVAGRIFPCRLAPIVQRCVLPRRPMRTPAIHRRDHHHVHVSRRMAGIRGGPDPPLARSAIAVLRRHQVRRPRGRRSCSASARSPARSKTATSSKRTPV